MAVVQGRRRGAGGTHVPPVGAHIEVHLSRGRVASRQGVVVDVRSFEGVSQGRVIVVRWDDDGCVSSLVPGSDVEVIDP